MKGSFTRKTVLVFFAAAIIFFAVLVYGALYISGVKVRTDALILEVERASEAAADSADVEKALDEFRAYQETIDSHLVPADDIVSFVEAVEDAAERANVELKIDRLEEAPVPPKALPTIERLVLVLSVRGAWQDVVRFGAYVDSLPYQIFVTGATLSTDRTSGSGGSLWVGSWNLSVVKAKSK